MDDMTPTYKLRALLNERGIAWVQLGESSTEYTMDGVLYRAYETYGGLQVAIITPVTPEQAIAATVGGYAITFAPTLDRSPETMVGETVFDGEGNAIGWIVNATAGAGTCHCTTPDDAWCFSCSSCGKSFPRDELYMAHNHGEINYCPNCGARIIEEVTE